MSLGEHVIFLKPNARAPLKEWYWPILPGVYHEVRVHIKEMLDIWAIWPSSSPWASTVMLVRMKGWKTPFCINLRKLNQLPIKDTSRIPCIEETLDCLKGAVWLTSLDLKSGFCQVKVRREQSPHHIHSGPAQFLQMWMYAIWTH